MPRAEEVAIDLLCMRFESVLLYGSCARGDDQPHSDVDVLVIDATQPLRIDVPARFSVSFYTPEHFRAMAHRGSLFVLHLREEARILVDKKALIPPLLSEWVPPDYHRLREGMCAAATVLETACQSVTPALLRRAALYVVRSVLYAECARRGRPSFAMSAVALVLGEPRISSLFDGLAATSDRHVVDRSRDLIAHYLGEPIPNPFAGLDALAVAWHQS